jgi:hypothetical protein
MRFLSFETMRMIARRLGGCLDKDVKSLYSSENNAEYVLSATWRISRLDKEIARLDSFLDNRWGRRLDLKESRVTRLQRGSTSSVYPTRRAGD